MIPFVYIVGIGGRKMKKQKCYCGHPIEDHIEIIEGKPIAGECINCDCEEYEEDKNGY